MKKKKMTEKENKYTVWVGGVEVNDYLLDIFDAEALAGAYKDDGYKDVKIEKIK